MATFEDHFREEYEQPAAEAALRQALAQGAKPISREEYEAQIKADIRRQRRVFISAMAVSSGTRIIEFVAAAAIIKVVVF